MLASNVKHFQTDNQGRVVGVQLGIHTLSDTKYQVYRVELIDEIEANGQTVAYCSVLDRNNVSLNTPVRMAWPWGEYPNWHNSGMPGNPHNQHMITEGYKPPNLGPYALFVGPQDAPISDIVYGLGLPFNRHVSFNIVFKERGGAPDDGNDAGDVTATMQILHELRRLNKHLGVK